MAGLQYYDINVAPGNTQRIGSVGRYLRYHTGGAGGADESIVVKADTGALACILKPGQAVNLPDEVHEWRIENYKNAGVITGIVIIGDGEITDSQVAGTVSIIDGGKARTLAGMAFCGAGQQSGVAAQLSTYQLFNPGVSTKNIIVEAFSMASATAQAMRFGWNTVSLGGAASQASKKAGGAVSVATAFNTTLAATPTGFQHNGLLNVGVSTPLIINLREPIVLPPGFGFCIQAVTANTDLSTVVEWYEEGA